MSSNTDNRGFWEYSIFQKVVIPYEEQNIKMSLKPENSFNPSLIHQYINPTLSKPEKIFNDFNESKIKGTIKKLNKTEQIIYDKYVKDLNNAIKSDIQDIETKGTNADPKTKEGKIHLMMKILENEIKKNNIDIIANIFLRLKEPQFELTVEFVEKYNNIINNMNNLLENFDLIKFQFEKVSSQMPPLNEKKFTKFDDWQEKVIHNIDNNISTILTAPTSAGKSVLAGYTVTKGKTLYIVPTDALAWQVSAYLSGILNSDVPIITLTYQTIPKRDEFIKLLNYSNAFVGTADSILDFLPLIKTNFKWIIYDEVHMIGKEEGFAMEIIGKILCDVSFLALSATVDNVEELEKWFKEINNTKIETIKCNKRFFNLQKYFYDNKNNEIKLINPLSMVNINEFKDKTIKTKNLDPTPIDTWTLVTKLLNLNVKLDNLDPYTYFDKYERIELSKATQYFNDLVCFLSDNYEIYYETINKLLNQFSDIKINTKTNLVKLIKKINDDNKGPAIIFHNNTISCLKIARTLSDQIDNLENKIYPHLYEEREKNNKKQKILFKKKEKIEKEMTEKQEFKKLLDGEIKESDEENNEYNAPHPDFIFTKDKINDVVIKEYHLKFKKYFPNHNGNFHFLIRLLWRGIGVYTIGLPDNYLRLIQTLANKKKLGFVFSDISLVFGVSMPFRTSVIYTNDELIDNLDPMIYHQMAGRAGRRCLDKEGNVIFVGYNWERIKDLSKSSIPKISGLYKPIYTFQSGNILSKNIRNYNLINNNMLYNSNYNNDFNDKIINNFNSIWSDYNTDDYNLNYLLWLLRYSNDAIICCILIPIIQKYFNNSKPTNELDQIELAYFLSNFLDIKYTNNNYDYLEKFNSYYKRFNLNEIKNILLNKNIKIDNNIDSRIWVSIRNNLLVNIDDDKLRQELFNFNIKLKALQHYFYHTKQITLAKLFGKLLTRIWWIYHSSSPVIRLT
jgi:superfamily II RNA helicase